MEFQQANIAVKRLGDILDNAGDVVIELEGEGTDTVDAIASTTLAANVENLRMVGTASISGTGNAIEKSRRWRYGECANGEWRMVA